LARNPDPSTLRDAALSYASRGLAVFPLKPGKKEPLGGHGHQDATTDVKQIEAWWNETPQANIGYRPPSGECVVDIDPRSGGEAAFASLVFRLGPLPPTVTTTTGGGGQHLRFTIPSDTRLPKQLATGIDLKGRSGYVVLPPSVHPSGRVYEWVPYSDPEEQKVAALPATWLDELRRLTATASTGSRPLPEAIYEGEGRDNAMISLAGTFRNRGLTGTEILAALRPVNESRCHPPLEERDLQRIARSASRYDPKNPIAPGRRTGLTLVPLGRLLSEPIEETRWLVDQLLPAGGLSILCAKPKVGKSTLARQLAVAVSRGDRFLGRATHSGGVIYLAFEEKKSEVLEHFKQMGITNEDTSIQVHFGTAPADAIEELRRLVDSSRPALVIVDTLFRMARVKDANDYAQVTAALEPLLGLARESGAHVLCVHHAGKNDRAGADGTLGSTAIFGSVDTALTLRRGERYRTIETQQRYGPDMEPTVLGFDPGTKTVSLGSSRADAEEHRLRNEIVSFFERAPGSATEADVLAAIAGDTGTKRRVLRDWKTFHRSGSGKKGDPFLYQLPRADDQTRILGTVGTIPPAEGGWSSRPVCLDEKSSIEKARDGGARERPNARLTSPVDEQDEDSVKTGFVRVSAIQPTVSRPPCSTFTGADPMAGCEGCGDPYLSHPMAVAS
jgi:hypothetical protein